MIHFRRAMLVVAGLCLVPMAAVLVSAILAALLGCELSEAGSNACSVFGLEIGGLLSPLFTLGWMALLTLPLLMGVVALWALIEGLAVLRRRRRARKALRIAMQDA